jgi:hypothetical protein
MPKNANRTTLALALVLMATIPLVLVGCTSGGEDRTTGGYPTSYNLADETAPADDEQDASAQDTSAQDTVGSLIETAASSNVSEPGAGQAAGDYGQLFEALQQYSVAVNTTAAQLRRIEPSRWAALSGADIDEFVSDACLQSGTGAAQVLLEKIPGADLRAAPALTQAMVLTVQDPRCGEGDPVVVDQVSNYLNSQLIANQQRADASVAAQSAGAPRAPGFLSKIFGFTCEAAGEGVRGWMERKVKAGGAGGFALTLVLGAGIQVCPDVLESVFS